MNGIGERVRLELVILSRRALEIGTINGVAAEMDQLLDFSAHAVGFCNRLQHARSSGHVDAPHAIAIENAGAQRIEDEREMYNSDGMRFAENQGHAPARRFLPKIYLFEFDRCRCFLRRREIEPNDMEIIKQRQ